MENTGMHPIIEPLDLDYYSQAAEWIADPDINRWLYAEWRERPVDEKLIAIVAMNNKNRLFLIRDGSDPVGIAAISQINDIDSHASIWYLLGDQSRSGKGIATAAIELLVRHAFEMLGIHSLEASVAEPNMASRRVLEKNAFQPSGCLREAFQYEGAFVDRIIYDRINTGE